MPTQLNMETQVNAPHTHRYTCSALINMGSHMYVLTNNASHTIYHMPHCHIWPIL